MPWRVVTAGYARYAEVCRTCGLQRGWAVRRSAERHVLDLGVPGLVVEAYPDGADDTCRCAVA